jgi:tetratricopeptide (TPR) repeat protein
VRVNAQLIAAESNAHLWTERFDRDAADLFELENEITGRIANSLGVQLIRAEANRPTEHLDALDHLFRGRAALAKSASRGRFAEAISSFERALDLNPRFVEAQSRLAIALLARVLDQMTDTEDADIARAEELIAQVLAFSPSDPRGHFAKGQLLRVQRRCAEAIPEFEAALASNRN